MMVDVEDVPSHGENADPYRAFEVTCCGTIAAKACWSPACGFVEKVCQYAPANVATMSSVSEDWHSAQTQCCTRECEQLR